MVSTKQICVYRLVLSSNHRAKRLFIVRTKKLRNETNENVKTLFHRVLLAIRVCSKALHSNQKLISDLPPFHMLAVEIENAGTLTFAAGYLPFSA